MKKWLTFIVAIVFAVPVAFYYALDPETETLNDAARKQLGGAYMQLSAGITHYAFAGPESGKVVVLVHGGTVPMWGWAAQVEALTGAGYRVLTYDQFGRGYSDRPEVTYDRAFYLAQLQELVSALGLPEQFDLVGVSFGAATAVNYTATHPDRIRSLILFSPIVNGLAAPAPAVFRVPVIGEFAARAVGIDMIAERFAKLVDGNPDAHRYNELFAEQTKYVGFQQSLLSMLRGDALGDYSDAYRAVGRANPKVLLVWGTADADVSRAMIDDARSLIPAMRFEPVEGAGHGLVLQQPDVVNKLMLEFLDRQ